MKEHKIFTDAFNNLPLKQREIAIKAELCLLINEANVQKNRIKKIYLTEITYWNNRIKRYEKELLNEYDKNN